MTSFRTLHVDQKATTTSVTVLSRTLTAKVLEELEVAIEQAPNTLIISGRDGYFAAGADISQIHQLLGPEALAFARRGQALLNKLSRRNAASVAAIDGFCLGGGLDLALACDLRYATARSTFAHPGGRIGILTGWGGTRRLPQTVGKSRALEMMVAGRWLDASEALDWGLIGSIVENPVEYAMSRTAINKSIDNRKQRRN